MEETNLFFARRLPARLTIEEAGKLLGFHPDSLDYLVEIGLLEVLGGASVGCQKMFAANYVLERCGDLKWLSKATLKVRQHIQNKNGSQRAARSTRCSDPPRQE